MATDPLIGQTLGKYKIERLLGEGGMGAVYQAQDPSLARTVAIKIMHRQFAQQADFRQRFVQEARTAARLDHAGIVKVHAFEETAGLLYIVMEYIAGDNLQQMLEKLYAAGKWIPLAEAVLLIRRVGDALDYAHRNGVLHRDVKPANIMLKLDPERPGRFQPIVTDLGLAKLNQGGLVTQHHSTMGTPAYMSPEQALGEETDPRSDVYSLGVLLFELSVGQRPFPIRSVTEAIRYHVHEAPPPPRSLRPELPLALERVILRAIEKQPAQRFASARAFVQALRALPLGELPTNAPSTAPDGAFSIVTQVQESLVGAASLGPLPSLTPANVDQLQIVTPKGGTREFVLGKRSLTIGRGKDNDLVLDDTKISRHHARLEFDGSAYRIVDLNSANGAYLDEAKLLPGVPQLWSPTATLRLGRHRMRLVRARAQREVSIVSMATTPAQAARPRTSARQTTAQTYKDVTRATNWATQVGLPSLPPVQRPTARRLRARIPIWMLSLIMALLAAVVVGFWQVLGFNGRINLPSLPFIGALQPSATPTLPPTPTSVPPTATATLRPTPTVAAVPVAVAPLPDLAIEAMTIRPQERRNCYSEPIALGIEALVVNRGAGRAAGFTVELNGLSQRIDAGLNGNETSTLWFPNQNPGKTTVIADAAGEVDESIEENNALTNNLALLELLPICTPTDAPAPVVEQKPTSTPFVTPTPPPTATPTVTNTPLPTNTPTRTPTRAPISTPSPTHPPTPTPNNGNGGGGSTSGMFRSEVTPVCNGERGYTWFSGTVFVNNQPANGYRVVFKSRFVAGDTPITPPAISGPNSQHSDWATGYYDHVVNDFFSKKHLEIWINDASGKRISDKAIWDTDGEDGPCNKAIINFRR